MIELSFDQRKDVQQGAGGPVRARDPDTQTTYVLVQEDAYNRVKELFADERETQFLRDMYPHVIEVFGKTGWDDPAMDVYDELDSRRQS